ncbi:MAG: ribonuclease III [Nitrospinae bacterium]|nr:ribonuclease III [Nitrospinota bacterium]
MISEDRLKELEVLQEKFNYKFKDINIFNQSLTHKSYVNENISENLQDNERLEFLGDAVLSLVVSDYSINRFTDYSEGDLTKIRAAVVSEVNLSLMAREMDLGRFLLLGKGEEMTGGRDKSSLLANAFEAVIAAIYLDSGYKETFDVLIAILNDKIDKVAGYQLHRDFKSDLQEFIQNRQYSIPQYRVAMEFGPPHEKIFEVEVMIDGEVFGIGRGKTKKEAEQSAAQQVLEELQKA